MTSEVTEQSTVALLIKEAGVAVVELDCPMKIDRFSRFLIDEVTTMLGFFGQSGSCFRAIVVVNVAVPRRVGISNLLLHCPSRRCCDGS
jgi:hypothetical protein